ncbi:MAG: glycosyltransferase family A protein [Alphaproteobacteria bacterium]
MNSPPLFSVVMCTYQRFDQLSLAIDRVLEQDIGADAYDIWVMDNSPASPERAASKAKYANTPNLHYIELDTPGAANARNEGIRLSQGNYIAFLDDDVLASPGWLRHHRDAFASAPDNVAAIGGRIVAGFEVPRPVWLRDSMLLYLSVFDCDVAPPDYQPISANVVFRRTALRDHGFHTGLGRRGNESNNLLSGEETALTNYIHSQGGKFGYAPLAAVTHCISAERLTRSWFRRRVSWQAISDQLGQGLSAEGALQLWPYIIDYLKKVPREHIACMGLLWDTDDSEIFHCQLICIKFFTQILISQGCYAPGMLG